LHKNNKVPLAHSPKERERERERERELEVKELLSVPVLLLIKSLVPRCKYEI